MDLSVFFDPINDSLLSYSAPLMGDRIGQQALMSQQHFAAWQEADLVIMGVPSLSKAQDMGDAIRQHLYPLSLATDRCKVVDLGEMKAKESAEAQEDALAYVLEQLLQAEKTVILLMEDRSITFAQHAAYEPLSAPIDYVHIGPRLDLSDPDMAPPILAYNQRIFRHEPNYLFNYTNLGYQRYFVLEEELNSLRDLNFTAVRYGVLHADIGEAEPYLREANLASFDLSGIRQADFGAGIAPSPGGFSATEACQIARYAGLGRQLTTFSLNGLLPSEDVRGQSAHLAAIMIWYFIEGFSQREKHQVTGDLKKLRRYNVQLRATVSSINFFEHPNSARWWMEVPYPDELGKAKPKTRLIPCSNRDYQIAQNDEIPDRWWKTFNKLA